MNIRNIRGISTVLLLAATLVTASAARADQTFQIALDTASLFGTDGFLELQYSAPASGGTATITDFTSDAVLGAAAPVGTVAGTLPGTVTITNDQTSPFNAYFQSLTFGNGLSFNIDLPAVTGGTFAASLLDSTGTQSLLTTSGDGTVASITTSVGGPATVLTPPAGPGLPPAASVSVPEPSALRLLTLGALGLLPWFRRRLSPG